MDWKARALQAAVTDDLNHRLGAEGAIQTLLSVFVEGRERGGTAHG